MNIDLAHRQTPATAENDSFSVATFYCFVALADVVGVADEAREICKRRGLRGTIIFAAEGINGTVAGSADGVDEFIRSMHRNPLFESMPVQRSTAERQPFGKLKIKVKDEIVSMGLADIDPNTQRGTYVEPCDWNELIADPDVIVIDTRNHFETVIGSFPNAQSPHTNKFSEFPAFAEAELSGRKDKKIAMFCTGGIRCEKATAYLKGLDFEQVYHLRGGILAYLDNIPEDQNQWQGECFVFDERATYDKSCGD